MVWKLLSTIFLLLHFQKSIDCQLERIHKYSKDFVFLVPDSMKYRQLVMASAPLINKHSDYVYFTNINCDDSNCQVVQHCFNCPNPNVPRICFFEAPSHQRSSLKEANLLHLGCNGELVIVDWVTKANVNETAMRKIQLIDLNSCNVKDISVRVSEANNKQRKIILIDDKYFELFYVDFKQCELHGWIKMRYDMVKDWIVGPECIYGTESSHFKFAIDVVERPNHDAIILDQDHIYWYLYKLPNSQNYAKELFKVSHKAAGSFDVPRITAGDDLAIFCWLPDTSFSDEISCVGGDMNGWFMKKFTLSFAYEVRDFEIQIYGSSLLCVLTSSSRETATKCNYDLWAFGIDNESKSEPIRIEGPPCMFEHRLAPRAVMTTGLYGDICVSFTFEQRKTSEEIYNSIEEQNFTVLVECFNYYHKFSGFF